MACELSNSNTVDKPAALVPTCGKSRKFSSGSAPRCAEKLRFSDSWQEALAAAPPLIYQERCILDRGGGVAAKNTVGVTEKQSFSAHQAAKPPIR
jgi:hypothetical protein